MGKLAPALTAISLAATLTACGSEAAPAPAPTPIITASPTPTGSPAPTPPVMPEAAKNYTDAGAEAFVVYYWQVVDYASATLDTTLLEKLTGRACASCWRGIRGLQEVARNGAHFTGGEETVSKLKVSRFADENVRAAMATYTVQSTAQSKVLRSGKTHRFPAETLRERLTLQWTSRGWQAVQLDLVK